MAVSLGDIVVRFLGDVSDLHKGVEESTGMLGGFGGLAADVGKRAGEALVEIGVESVKMAGEFQQGLTQLVTGAGEKQKNLAMVGDGIKQISVESATSTKALTDGMYMIESAGFHGAAGLDVLKASAEGARAGNANLATAASAVTTMMVDYSNKHYTATEAMNALIATEQVGKTHLEDLGRSMGAVLPLASSLGVSFPQVAGGIAVMTNAGMTAQHASQNLANALRNLAAPSGKASNELDYLGLTAQKVKDTLGTQGLGAALQLIEDHVAKKFPAGSSQAVAAFKTIMGGATGYNVALMLGGEHMKDYEANVKSIGAALSKNASDVEGFSLVQQSFSFQLDKAKMAGNALMITLGQALLPVFTRLLSALTPLIEAVTSWVSHLSDAGGVISQVAGVFNSTFQPAISGITTAVKPLTDSFDRASGIIRSTTEVVKPLTDSFDRAKDLIASTTQVVKPLTDSFDRGSAVMLHMSTTVHTATQPLSPLASAFKAVAEVVKAVADAIGGVISNGSLAALVKSFGDLGNTLSGTFGPVLQSVGQTLSSLFGSSGPLKNAPSLTDLLTGAINGLKTAVDFVNTTIKTGKTVVDDLKKAFDDWKPTIETVSGILLTFFAPAIIKAGVEAVISGAKLAVSFIANIIKTGVEAALAGPKLAISFVTKVIDAGVEGWTSAGKLAVFVGNIIKTGVEAVISGAKIAASFVASIVKAGAEAVAAGAKIVASFVASIVKAGVEAVISGAKMLASLVPALISVAAEAMVAAVTAIPTLVAGFITWAATAGAAAIATIAATWPILVIIGAIALLAVGIYLLVTHWKEVTTFLTTVWANVSSWVIKTFTNIKNGISDWISHAWTTLSDWFGKLVKWFGDLPAKALTWGQNLIQGFIDGINGMVGNVGKAVSKVGDTIKGFLGIHSPAKFGPLSESDQWAPNLVKMYAGGIAAGVPQIASASSVLAAPVGPRLNAPTNGGSASSARSQTAHIHVYLGGKEIVSQLMPMVYDEARAMTGWRPVG